MGSRYASFGCVLSWRKEENLRLYSYAPTSSGRTEKHTPIHPN